VNWGAQRLDIAARKTRSRFEFGRPTNLVGDGGSGMRIKRHEKDAEWLDYEDWPVLVDAPLSEIEPRWLGNYGDSEGPWVIWLEGTDVPADGSPAYRYLVELRELDFSEVLARMPPGGVKAVLEQLLREGDPETIGAMVGLVVTHLAQGVARKENP
jgi:hypothetical protein